MMTQLNYLMEAPFECAPDDANVTAFVEATSIIGCCDVVEEFLACGMWSLSEKFGFMVETKETPLSSIMVSMPKVMPTIGVHESKVAFETCIVNVINLLVDNYNITEHNAYKGLQHGQLNRIFELADVLCQPDPEPIVHATRKQKSTATVPTPAPKKATEK
jgi:hypothetical protein